MPNKFSRRSFLKTIFTLFLAALGIGSGGYFYARNIEPRLIQITQHSIKDAAIPKSFANFKIIQFSDTHLGFQYDLYQLEKLMAKINRYNPDIIFFTGDLMDEPNKYRYSDKIAPFLKQLKAPFGKFAVYGNHDHGDYGSDLYKQIMEDSDFTLLRNDARQIKLLDKSSVFVIGIDDKMLGKPDLEKSVEHVPANAYKILLSHAPDLADEAAPLGIQLQLSGHSHGGQIKIPFVGALVTPPFARKYTEGFYTIGKPAPLTLYVNRGLGTTRLPFRFLSRPELTIFTLNPEKE